MEHVVVRQISTLRHRLELAPIPTGPMISLHLQPLKILVAIVEVLDLLLEVSHMAVLNHRGTTEVVK